MRHLATILISLLLAVPVMSVELFRYRGAAKDGGTMEYVFEAGEQNFPDAVTKEKAAEIAADFRRGSRAACSGCSPGASDRARSHRLDRRQERGQETKGHPEERVQRQILWCLDRAIGQDRLNQGGNGHAVQPWSGRQGREDTLPHTFC